MNQRYGTLLLTFGMAALPFGLDAGSAVAAGQAAGEQRTIVGTCVPPTGLALQYVPNVRAWQALTPESPISGGDTLVALTRAAILSKNGAVQLTLSGRPPLDASAAGQDSAVVLGEPGGVDLEVILRRGRVSVANVKNSGAAKVRLRFLDQTWEVSLADKGSAMGFEAYGEWPRGMPFTREPKEGVAPLMDLVAIVLQGQVDLKAGSRQFAMSAAPGPAFFHWNSIAGQEPGPRRVARTPSWIEVDDNKASAKRWKAYLDQSVTRALSQTLLESSNPVERRLAVYGLAATDDLPALLGALGQENHADVRQAAAVALRDWISRGPGQDKKLYDVLVTQRKYPAGQAEIVLQLLHAFGDRELARPETYETLIAYLRHSKLPIRELARWQIYGLVPAGKAIVYDAAGSAESRERAYKQWQNLIPEGRLPPAAKPGER